MIKPLLMILMTATSAVALAADRQCATYLDHNVRKLRSGDHIDLCEAFAGKPLLIVNTASHCGFTNQFTGLEALHQAYGSKGLEVLGVPSNDFRQAASDEESAARVCYVNYGVTFTMLSQQKVRGPEAHPVFLELGRQAGQPTWNFNKYLVDPNGKVIKRFESSVDPMSDELRTAVEALLQG